MLQPTMFRVRPDNPVRGYSRAELAKSVCDIYRRIYKVSLALLQACHPAPLSTQDAFSSPSSLFTRSKTERPLGA